MTNQLLNASVIGNLLKTNPSLANQFGLNQDLTSQAQSLGFGVPTDGTMFGATPQAAGFPQASGPSTGNSGRRIMRWSPTQSDPQQGSSFLQAGQQIPGQMTSNMSVWSPDVTTNDSSRYSSYQFSNPNVNFSQRSPYQFQTTPQINVADTYTPQYQMASRSILDQGQQTQEQLLRDLNQRGMLTTGAANRSMQLQSQEQNRKLADLASQYSIEQGRAQLQEDQMRRQMETQRQLSQAEEIFKQQGATDAQAQFLAGQNFNTQNAQAGQNLAGFNANLGAQQQQYGQRLSNANLNLQQLTKAFEQNLQGRQQGTQEMQLANLTQRQPLEDLFKLWGQQSSPFGGTQGSPGLMGILGNVAGAAAGAYI